MLSPHPVQTLAVRTDPAGRAIVEITVAEAHRVRIRGKLLRMVDVLDVVDATDV